MTGETAGLEGGTADRVLRVLWKAAAAGRGRLPDCPACAPPVPVCLPGQEQKEGAGAALPTQVDISRNLSFMARFSRATGDRQMDGQLTSKALAGRAT